MIKTLHDEWKEWEKLGISREKFEGSYLFAFGSLGRAIRAFNKCFYIELIKFSRLFGGKMKGFIYRTGCSIKEFGETTRLVIFIKLGLIVMDWV